MNLKSLAKHLRTRAGSRGAAMLELALITPVIFALSFGTFELAKVQRTQQMMSYISSEAVRLVFQRCTAYGAPSLQACVNQTALDINSQAATALPGAEVVLSVYQFNSPVPADRNQDFVQLSVINGVELSNSNPATAGKTPAGRLSRYTPPLDPMNTGNPDPNSDFFRHIAPYGSTPPIQTPPIPVFPLDSVRRTNRFIVIAEVYYRYLPKVGGSVPYFTVFTKELYEHTIL